MIYTQPFKLSCYETLREYFRERLADLNTDESYVGGITIPVDLHKLFVDEMKAHGLIATTHWIIFKKRHKYQLEAIHVDPTHVSIILPIDGYEKAPMCWFIGDHELISREYNRIPYHDVKWKNVTKVKVHYQDINSPSICRVDIPHDTVSDSEGNYRTVATIRLENNPTFEEVCAKLT